MCESSCPMAPSSIQILTTTWYDIWRNDHYITKLKTIYGILRSEKKIVSQVDCPAAESLFVAVAPEVKKGMLFYKLMYELSRNFLDHEMTAYLGRVLNSNPIFQVFKRMPGFKVVKEATIYDLQWTFYIYDIKAGFEDFEKLAYNFWWIIYLIQWGLKIRPVDLNIFEER